MEKSMTQTPLEKQLLSEAELEIRKNVEDLMKWLDGSLKYFVRSIKGLAELSKDKEMFNSYVANRLLENLAGLSEIVDLYNMDKDDEDSTQKSFKGKKFFLNAKNIDFEDLTRYYTSEILTILASNTEAFDNMRFRISMLHFVSKNANEFGYAVLDYITHKVLATQTMNMPRKVATIICLMTAVRDHEYDEYGEYAESIKDIIDNMSLPVCMSIIKDYETAHTPDKAK